jgi:predicted RNA-binding protein YlxR (DUF448 family)
VSEPVRTCAGCGRRAPQHELVRFAVVDGALTAGRMLPGRGAYTCRSRDCFRSARRRRSFARTLRTTVVVGDSLECLYTDTLDG